MQSRWRSRQKDSVLKQAGDGNFKEPEQSLIQTLDLNTRNRDIWGHVAAWSRSGAVSEGTGSQRRDFSRVQERRAVSVHRSKQKYVRNTFSITPPPIGINQDDPELWPVPRVKGRKRVLQNLPHICAI